MKYPIYVGKRIVGKRTLVPLTFDLSRYPFVLVTGVSGSGKSYLTKLLFRSLLKYQDKIEIFCFDFKNSGDYDFMDEQHLSVGASCIEMLDVVYQRYIEIKDKNLADIVLVCFDEYAAFISWLMGYDKKLAQQTIERISTILMTARRLNKSGGGVYMWTILQRPDATYFGTARDNYFVKIVMRDVTRSIRTMLELDEEDIPQEHTAKTGHGIMVIDNNVYAFIVPTYNERAMNAMLTAKRSEAVGIADSLTT